jgi:hypothetical protein
MRINLRGKELSRYREIRKEKMKFQKPDKRIPTVSMRIKISRLSYRQRIKMEELEMELD